MRSTAGLSWQALRGSACLAGDLHIPEVDVGIEHRRHPCGEARADAYRRRVRHHDGTVTAAAHGQVDGTADRGWQRQQAANRPVDPRIAR